MAYASAEDVQDRMLRTMSDEERDVCEALLEDAAVLIDATAQNAPAAAKKVVSCRMVIRAIGDGNSSGSIPTGATQGSMSGLGYTQSWTMGNGGGAGELYIGKADRTILGCGNKIGAYSPTQELVPEALS